MLESTTHGLRRLRIALVAEAADTGLATLLYLSASGLAARGHDVHFLSSVERTDKEMRRRLERVPGVRCVSIAMTRAAGLKDGPALLAIRRYLRQQGPFDIVHGHSSKGGALARLAALGLPGARLYTPHAFYSMSSGLSRASRFGYALAERALARLCSKVVCSSMLEQEHARAIGIQAEKLAIVGNAIMPPAIAPAARARFGFGGERSIIIGFVGRLEYQKGPDLLLKAFARASTRNSRLRLVVIGDGTMAQALAGIAEQAGIQDRVAFLGRRKSTDYLASFDVLALPSRYEGFSLMPLEAMYAGLPIVCANVGGISESVTDGKTGLVVPPEDEIALANALLALSENASLRLAMGEAARKRAHHFSPAGAIEATERLYFEALGSLAPLPAPPPRIAAQLPLAERK
jgi:glycosyltransferase involved in cell wall biosynthesis